MTDDESSLTVAVPTCNGAPHLVAALRSIVAQRDSARFDLLIVDDHSDDDTLEIVRHELGDAVRVSVNSERLGLAANWNRCVALSRTPWVAIFHQDDVMRPGHIAGQLGAIARWPDLGFICGAYEVIDAKGQRVSPDVIECHKLDTADRTYARGEFVADLAVRNPVRCSTVALRKLAHAEVGGFDPALRYAVDWDFWYRVAREFPVAWLAEPTVAVRWHATSETHRFRRGTADLEEVARVIETIFRNEGHTWPDRKSREKSAARRLARAYLNRAYEAARAGAGRLCRRCLRRASKLWPGILWALMRNPRLAARIIPGALAPPSHFTTYPHITKP
jgi:glycosyltransferase involved in cell wall biosynthesis